MKQITVLASLPLHCVCYWKWCNKNCSWRESVTVLLILALEPEVTKPWLWLCYFSFNGYLYIFCWTQ